jgi:hypothetical protein
MAALYQEIECYRLAKLYNTRVIMTLDEALTELRARNEPVPRPVRLPTAAEVDAAERRLGVRFPSDFRRYLREASDVTYGTIEPVAITAPDAHTDLFKVARSAWDANRVPRDLLPICEDNADFFCLNVANEVIYWAHNGTTDEKWPSLAAWIDDVWLASG